MSQPTEQEPEPYYWSEIENATKKFQEQRFFVQSDKPREKAVESIDIPPTVWPEPMFDSIDVIITARYAPVITYPEAITRCRV